MMMLIAFTSSRAQVSPGPLAAPHAALDTPLKCFACHGQGAGSLRERCLECHKEIAWQVGRKVGLHGQPGMEKCAKCHPDHAGRDFEMINWEEGSPDRFDHRRTGWPLEGKHATAKCADCHKPAFQSTEILKLSPRKSPSGKSWLGLVRDCVSCHARRDVHRGSLGKDCGKCHGDTVWKPASRFDHNRTDYPLTGRHAKVECDKCHKTAGLKLPVNDKGVPQPLYKPIPHKECSACHADPHKGQLGPACARCHATDDWKRVDAQAFNHDQTRYPLRGKHRQVKCEQCHDPKTAWGKKPPFASCGSCHPDVHAGKATLLGKVVDCASCHGVEGWKPSTYGVDQHAGSRYPLKGAHTRVKCEACHLKDPPGVLPAALGKAGVLMRPAFDRCATCHRDAHGGQLARRPDRGACEPCHRVEGWKPSTYTVRDHARLRLTLGGRHGTVACAACHGADRKGLRPLPGAEVLGTAKVAILLKEIDCVACHFDPHDGRFVAKGARAKAKGCVTCHGLEAFRPASVDVLLHRTFGAPLEGAHRATPCDACHTESKLPRAGSTLVLARGQTPAMPFVMKDTRCVACHANVHGTQFARRRDKGVCQACHNEDAFKPASRFNHDLHAAFPLKGAHARVACAKCHPTRKDAAGKPMVVYTGIKKECRACHGSRPLGKLTQDSPDGPGAPPVALTPAHARKEQRT